jgi:hypothetical protein
MNPSHIALGAVFESEWSPNPVRVVAFDRQVVMYDTWWPHKDAWAMSKLLGAFSYYRLSRTYFEAHSRYVRTDPLSEQELKIHRPDLPFAFAQRSNNSWYEPRSDFDMVAPNLLPNAQPVLRSPAVFLSPFGPRDSTKPAVLVHADNGSYFTEAELLRQAKAIQAPIVGEVHLTDGVGIHRLGIKKRIPSYYIWGYNSRLETSA